MSIQHGNLGIVRDGLIFYYDFNSRKCHRGEPGYNLLDAAAAKCDAGATSYFGGTSITASNYDKGLKSFKATTLQGGYFYLGNYYSTGIIVGTPTPYRHVPSGSYSLSCKVWVPAGRRIIYGFRYYPQGEEFPYALIGNDSWQTIERNNLTTTRENTLNIQIAGTSDSGISNTTSPDVIPSFTFYVAEPMINSGSYALPYYEPTSSGLIHSSNVVASNYSYGALPTTFTKGVVGDSWTNARITSSNAFSHSARLAFTAGQTNKYFMMALNSDPATGINWSNLDYAIYCKHDGSYEIRENGSGTIVPTGSATYTTSSVFEIKYDGKSITYWKENSIVRTASRPVTNALSMDSSFYSDSTVVNNVIFTSGRSDTIEGGGGLIELSKVSNINLSSSTLSYDVTGSKVTTTGSYLWFGSSNIQLADTTNDGNSHTFEMWMMTLGTPPGVNTGYVFGRRGNHSGFYQSGTTVGCLVWYSDGTAGFIGSSYTSPYNKWNHFTMTVNEITNETKFYVNGVQNGVTTTMTKALRTYTSDYQLYAGSATDYAGNCRINVARIYRKALTPAEILRNYNAQKHIYQP